MSATRVPGTCPFDGTVPLSRDAHLAAYSSQLLKSSAFRDRRNELREGCRPPVRQSRGPGAGTGLLIPAWRGTHLLLKKRRSLAPHLQRSTG